MATEDDSILTPLKLDAFVFSRRPRTRLSLTSTLLQPGLHPSHSPTTPSCVSTTTISSQTFSIPWSCVTPDGDKEPDDGSRPSDPAAPTFPTVQNQWLVIRFIENKDSIQPAAARRCVKNITAWVVESNRLWKLDDLGADVDLQVDALPFISAADGKDTSVAAQAEVFIGIKTLVEDWEEEEKENEKE
ncbi:hypothetical protein FPANT_7395 [Fusarium pseudoanthophilum]|uniref:Uncharacterized protein n=1 Tax=Fusarium pseudoanthophilum TaxID=48495 RepID=A0A8H5L6S9_9HYPO|nr:hypothetical protein FPANT_7395 [Fusarium pseudoanthophilum]